MAFRRSAVRSRSAPPSISGSFQEFRSERVASTRGLRFSSARCPHLNLPSSSGIIAALRLWRCRFSGFPERADACRRRWAYPPATWTTRKGAWFDGTVPEIVKLIPRGGSVPAVHPAPGGSVRPCGGGVEVLAAMTFGGGHSPAGTATGSPVTSCRSSASAATARGGSSTPHSAPRRRDSRRRRRTPSRAAA